MNINFDKYPDGLVPCIVQDARTKTVLMLGFMNNEALSKTIEINKVTFYSRSKERLWTKGETSHNFLIVQEILPDCDSDTILIKALPAGPVCHTGSDTCFGEKNEASFLFHLEEIISERRNADPADSYTASLFAKGIPKIAQKVGEEAVEVVIEAMRDQDEKFENESADLLFHFLVLLQSKGRKLDEILSVLKDRHLNK